MKQKKCSSMLCGIKSLKILRNYCLVIMITLVSFKASGQEFPKPIITLVPKQTAFKPIEIWFLSDTVVELIDKYIKADTSKSYFIEHIMRGDCIDLLVLGIPKLNLSDTSGIIRHKSSTFRYFKVNDIVLPILPYLDKEFSEISLSYHGEVLFIRLRYKYDRNEFEWAIIEQYDKLRSPLHHLPTPGGN